MSAPTLTYKMILGYDGAGFHGVAPAAGYRTVGSVLVDAITMAAGTSPRALAFSARTDAGVHATGQVCSFRLPQDAPLQGLRLPADLWLRSLSTANRSFHARASASAKHYRYRVLLSADREDPRAWNVRVPVDLQQARLLGRQLLGTRDFAAMRHPRCASRQTVRTLHAVDVRKRGSLMVIDVVGDGFLRQMVRILAGTLISAGAGWLSADDVMAALSRGDRSGLGPTAPACGLTLRRVMFDPADQSPHPPDGARAGSAPPAAQ